MRAQPAKSLRFRRNILVGGVAIFAIGMAATMWWALAPHHRMAIGTSMPEAEAARLPPDQLAGLPKSYDAVPQLRQQLLGEMGRPRSEVRPVGEGGVRLPTSRWWTVH